MTPGADAEPCPASLVLVTGVPGAVGPLTMAWGAQSLAAGGGGAAGGAGWLGLGRSKAGFGSSRLLEIGNQCNDLASCNLLK